MKLNILVNKRIWMSKISKINKMNKRNTINKINEINKMEAERLKDSHEEAFLSKCI